MYALFYNTAYKINAKDHTPSQLDVWAPKKSIYRHIFKKNISKYAIMAKSGDVSFGYGNIDDKGCLDHLYVASNRQGQGIGSTLCDALENRAKNCGAKTVRVQAFVTAKGFFERRGYVVIKEQFVIRQGVALKNYVMIKSF